MKWMFLIATMLCFSSISCQHQERGGMQPEDTEVWSPVPPVVNPRAPGVPPSDAIILFDGTSLDAWCASTHPSEPSHLEGVMENAATASRKDDRGEAPWKTGEGYFEVVPGTGAMETKASFGSIQLHIEWMAPEDPGKEGQDYRNSGIFLMGLYEIQVLNAYQNKTYVNGMAGSVYKQHIPLVNAANPPGAWQTYDIVFNAPAFEEDGKLVKPAYVTLFWNGVLVQNHVELKGPTLYVGEPTYFAHAESLPLRLQDHGDRVLFRNIWVRKLGE